MKKLIVLALCSVILLSLTACGSNSEKAAEAAPETTVAETTAAETKAETAAETAAPAAEQETREGDGSDMAEATQYTYELKENENLFIEKTVFNQDVIIKGDFGQITFVLLIS